MAEANMPLGRFPSETPVETAILPTWRYPNQFSGPVIPQIAAFGPATPMIQHVTREIPPSQLDECLRFYGLLGLRAIPVPDSIGDRAVWLAPSDGGDAVHLHLMLVPNAAPAQGHVAFVVADYDATVDRLRDRGLDVEPRREHWGAPRSYVRDPAGNVVELMARAPDEA